MRPGRGIRFAKMAPRRRETDSNRRSLSCTHRPLVAEGNAVAIERGSLVIVVFLMRARGIPLPPPVCPSASEIAARLPRITTARDGVAAAPGLSSLRDSVMSARCGRRTARHFRQLAVIKIAIQALISEVFSPVALTKIEV